MITVNVEPLLELLSARERETLILLLHGCSEKGVSESLGLSKQTVHVYVKNLYRTFRVRDKGQLLAKFILPETIAHIEQRCGLADVDGRPSKMKTQP